MENFASSVNILDVIESSDTGAVRVSNKIQYDPVEQPQTLFTWGTKELDKQLSPLQRNHFVIFAGDKGSGKTAYTLFAAIQNAKAGRLVNYISLEMDKDSLLTRICRSQAGITVEEWRDKSKISSSKLESYYKKQEELYELSGNLRIYGKDDIKELTTMGLGKFMYNSLSQMTFIDNFNLIETEHGENELEADKRISKFFMDFTNRFNHPVVVLHHLSKNGSVRGSQKILDNADTVMIGRRNVSENATEGQKKEFTIFQAKDRDFGNFANVTVYFERGNFIDNLIFEI